MNLVIFGLSITSSWGNGHATTFRALCQALHRRGHRIVFFEHNLEWYQNNRDLPHPPYCEVNIFEDWKQALPLVRQTRQFGSPTLASVTEAGAPTELNSPEYTTPT